MATEDKKPHPERAATDQSLEVERTKTDQELRRLRSTLEEDADSVVHQARRKADAVLKAARDREDQKLARNLSSSAPGAHLGLERQEEDRALRDERDLADQQLHAERELRNRVLLELLLAERQQTDRHLLIERIRADEAVTTRDDFLGIVSHDLRTMISGVALTASMLARNATDDPAGRKLLGGLEQIQRSTTRMHQLIGDLLDVASLEAGRLAVLPMAQDVCRLLRDIVEVFQSVADAKGLTLELRVPGEPVMARCDYGRIIQVLSNLVSNAFKFTPTGGRISISVAAEDAGVRVSVADTGRGIPEEHQTRIFERFWKTSASNQRGLGLGLFITRGIVEAHGGRLWVESRLEVGSTFHFTLPAA